ncbi:putative serine esterase-domain-containing protein [Lipomyces oligophaga]|uniref:putative serine esterase-domain-containing protein n=1 Tax=Lipomyces oligophaga TaxID=45792 RepID=UPI0034CD79A9
MAENHLFVLIHGLWGNASHMNALSKTILDRYPSAHVLVSSSFSGTLTYDGVEICGERVILEIKSYIKTAERHGGIISKMSLLGYSFGGLVARFVAGQFEESSFFERYEIEPVNFITFATPHLGVVTASGTFWRRLTNWYGKHMLGQSGVDMFLAEQDGGIVAQMAEHGSVYLTALKKFKRRSNYANVTNDRTVPFFTAFIDTRDPFTDVVNCRPHYVPDTEKVVVDFTRPMASFAKGKPVKTPWTTGQYVFLGIMCTIGPIVVTILLTSFCVTTSMSAYRVRKARAVKREAQEAASMIEMSFGGQRTLPSYSTSSSLVGALEAHAAEPLLKTHLDAEASVLQDTVETFLGLDGEMNGAETFPSPDSSANVSEYDQSGYSVSTVVSTSDHKLSKPANSLDIICQSVHQQRLDNRDFAEPAFCGNVREPEIILPLESQQFLISQQLNALSWEKYAIHIHSTRFSHAGIVARKKPIPEGIVVLNHCVERLVI